LLLPLFDITGAILFTPLVPPTRSDNAYSKFQALDSLSKTLTSYALQQNMTFPFVTVANSATLFEPYLHLADSAAIVLMPIVPAELRAEWEAFSVAQQGWIDEDLATRKAFTSASAADADRSLMEQYEKTISPYIKNYVGIDTSPGAWIVWWQYAPVIANRWFVNLNRLSWDGFAEEAEFCKQKQATISHTWSFQTMRDFEFTDGILQAGDNGGYSPGEPLSYIHYPILDKFDIDGNTVAILSATIAWKNYLENILPDNVKGVVCVVKNSQGQAFTFRIDGAEATFLGLEDLHDDQFDHLRVSGDYSSFSNTTDAHYTGFPVADEHISYSIHVFPSTTMKENYVSNKPIIYTAAIMFIFLFTGESIFLSNKS